MRVTRVIALIKPSFFEMIASQHSTTQQVLEETTFSDWVDRELVRHATSSKVICPDDLDHLLELRELLTGHARLTPASVVRHFFRLREALNENYYLLCYRLRNWVSVYYELEVSDPMQREASQIIPVDTRFQRFDLAINRARFDFFEQATAEIPVNDIRIAVARKAA